MAGRPYGALQHIYTSKSGLPLIQHLQHTYDDAGNISRWQDLVAGEDFTYEYDDLDRIVKRKVTGGADLETFAYNQIGNMTTKNGLNYSYDTIHKHAAAAYNGVSYGYDPNGNLTSAASWTYSYDRENRMLKATSGGTTVARFAYGCKQLSSICM